MSSSAESNVRPDSDPELVAIGAVRDDLGPDPLLSSMRNAADELDEIVADAMTRRRTETWRDIDLE